MKSETDLEEVKRIARIFLMFEAQKTEFSPMIVKHPFTDSGIVFCKENESILLKNILTDESDAGYWREEMWGQIQAAKSAHEIIFRMTKSYRLVFLKYVEAYLSRRDLSQILGSTWVSVEAPNIDPNFSQRELIPLFEKADPGELMDKDELEQWEALDESVTVYRGVTSHNAKNIRALSWSLDKNVATWFASRFQEDGRVYEAQINKEHIYALFNGRREWEVIVDPKFLREIQETEEWEEGLSIKQ